MSHDPKIISYVFLVDFHVLKQLMLQEWPDATDTGEESDSSVGRPDDMPAPAGNHEVPHINVEVLNIMFKPYILICCTN